MGRAERICAQVGLADVLNLQLNLAATGLQRVNIIIFWVVSCWHAAQFLLRKIRFIVPFTSMTSVLHHIVGSKKGLGICLHVHVRMKRT